ncbi:unnamed protein product, partial [Brachionus calyciflorus]
NQASTVVNLSKEDRIPDLSNFRQNVFGSSFLHACEDSVLCYGVNRFEIPSNYSFNCYEYFFPIFFVIESIDNRTALLNGFLNQNGVSIEDSQSFNKNCRKIRRVAIYKDFVPFYLGCDKEREFFLRHNNEMVKQLFDLEHDQLAVVIDGTYTRLEKSANNKFQYSCWSGQKKDLLIKPFIICCTDGYFLDCYGPFQAFENDAKIFKYIVENDSKLRKILLPKKTLLFIDRGFKDIFNFLQDELQLEPKIPTCSQLEDTKSESKQLTTKQTTESRFVTKIRFIVEKQIGMLKNFKALDNIRNTQAGHIQIDYRITCAMINFTHKRSCPDKENKRQNDYTKEFGNSYKVFIEYIPSLNKSKSIKNYVCSCKSGLKVAGCCTHVSSTIYYLSLARFQQIRVPGENLNKIFLDKIKKQKQNEPKYVRHKRFARPRLKKECEIPINEIASYDDKLKKNKQKKLVLESKSLEKSSKENKKRQSKNNKNIIEELNRDLLDFKTHLPSWGGKIQYFERDILLTNTCTIHYYLLAFWYLSKIKNNYLESIKNFSPTKHETLEKNYFINRKSKLEQSKRIVDFINN